MNNCQSCYTCEAGIVKTVDKEQFLRATENGTKPIPPEMIITNCQSCFSCQKCFTSQQPRDQKG